jgi:hypothetical protein
MPDLLKDLTAAGGVEDPPVHRRLDSWFPTLTGVSRLVMSA